MLFKCVSGCVVRRVVLEAHAGVGTVLPSQRLVFVSMAISERPFLNRRPRSPSSCSPSASQVSGGFGSLVNAFKTVLIDDALAHIWATIGRSRIPSPSTQTGPDSLSGSAPCFFLLTVCYGTHVSRADSGAYLQSNRYVHPLYRLSKSLRALVVRPVRRTRVCTHKGARTHDGEGR